MNAYIVNDTEFIAAANPAEAATIHHNLTQDEEIDVRLADLTTPWREDGGKPTGTLAEQLAKATKPMWLGSTEV